MEKASARAGREWPVSTGSGRSSPERGGGPPKVVEGHGRSRVTYKGQETPRVPLHHASHRPPPPVGEERPLPTPNPPSPRGHRYKRAQNGQQSCRERVGPDVEKS